MTDEEPIDRLAAEQLLRNLATAVFQSGHLPSAMRLMTVELRREWANDWVVEELEWGAGRLPWSERSHVIEALTSMDIDHGLWDSFAAETLATLQEVWAVLPTALENRDPESIAFRWHRRQEDLIQTGATWTAYSPKPTSPLKIWVNLEEHDGTLLIAHFTVDD